MHQIFVYRNGFEPWLKKNEKIMFAIQFISFKRLHTGRRYINGKITHPKSVFSNAIQKKEGNFSREEWEVIWRKGFLLANWFFDGLEMQYKVEK